MFIEYYETGLVPIPIMPQTKRPVKDAHGFNEWAHRGIPRPKVEFFDEHYNISKGFGIGIVCGSASNIVVVDIDTDAYDVMHACPPSPLRRRGQKGEARFFQFNPDLHNCNFSRKDAKGNREGVDILVEKKYIIVPPSIHPETKRPYVWLTPDDLMSIDINDLPVLTPEQVDEIGLLFGRGESTISSENVDLKGVHHSPDGKRCPHGSYMRVKTLAQALISKRTPIENAVQELLKYDETHHQPIGYFSDKRRAADFGADPYSNALRLYANLLKSTNQLRLNKGLSAELPEVHIEVDVSALLADTKENEKIKLKSNFKAYPKPRGAMLEFVKYCEIMGKGRQDAIGLGGALVMMGALASNRFQSKVRGLPVWPNLYVLNLGYSSFGKDVCQRLLDDLFSETQIVGSANYRSGTSMVQDLPIQQERVDIIDECSWLLKAMNQGDNYQSEMVELLSILFSRSSSRFNGIASAASGSRFGACWNPSVNILASTTPMGFRESVNQAMASKGLMPRFIAFFQKEIGHYKGASDISAAEGVKKKLQKWVDSMFAMEKPMHPDFQMQTNYLAKHQTKSSQDLDMGVRYDPRLIPLTKEAHAAWLQYEKKNHYLSAREPDGFESAFYGRFAELAAKVALLDTLGQSKDEINLDSLNWSIELIETCWHNVRPLYELSTAENLLEANHIRLLNIITEAGGIIQQTKLTLKTQWLSSNQRDDIIKTLLESERIQCVVPKDEGKRGPKKKYFQLINVNVKS